MLQYHITRPIRRLLYQALPLTLALIVLFPAAGQAASAGGGASGQMDGPTFFSFLMISLVDLSVIFWVGAQLWHAFVLQLADADTPSQQAIDQQAAQQFQRRFSISTLLLILLANVG